LRRVELAHARGELAQRDEHCARNPADLKLVGLADIHNQRRLSSIHQRLQFNRTDLVFHVRRHSISCRLIGCPNPARRSLVRAQLPNAGVEAAHGTIRILPQRYLAEPHPQGVVNQEPSDERLADSEHQLDSLGRLNRTDDSWQHPQNAGLGTVGYQASRRGLRVQASITGPLFRGEDRRLPFEPGDAAVDVGTAGENACVVDEITRGKIVRSIDDHVVRRDEIESVVLVEQRLVRFDRNV
jgi:hypothetical protein